MDDIDDGPPVPAHILEAIERSKADIAAGRIEDFDTYLASLQKRIEDYCAAREDRRSAVTRNS
jgi:phage host-nuclease inhibitor protein Gam